MDAYQVLQSAHAALLQSLEGINPDHATSEHRVYKDWTLKELVSHLAASEKLLEESLSAQLSTGAITPELGEYRKFGHDHFSQNAIQLRKDLPFQEIVSELNSTHLHAMQTLYLFTPQMLHQKEPVKWYRDGMRLSEYLQEQHDHKMEHARQIREFRKYFEKIDHTPTK